MWKRISLRMRILAVLVGLVLVTVGGGLVSIFYTYTMNNLFSSLLDKDVVSLQAAQALENALVMQKGYVTYFFQDADPEWLKLLRKQNEVFEQWLEKARALTISEAERSIINQLQSQYIRFTVTRDEVIDLYKSGKKGEGFMLHKTMRSNLFNLITSCHELRKDREDNLEAAKRDMKYRAQMVNLLAGAGLLVAVVLALILTSVLVNDVLGPIRKLAMDPSGEQQEPVRDEVKALSIRFKDLIQDVDQTRSKLKWSTEHLEQAEKWALVGKLAAGVSHSVRNPLTSVKMRLFSMQRTLSLTSSQKEDFEVISEEIRHIDFIVGNFLEFSRPPKLKIQQVSPSDIVDMAIELLRHRLESYDVKVEIKRDQRLPDILADPDQLKEVLVNLIVNSCEAMVDGGKIIITETHADFDGVGPVAVLKVQDNGPGVAQAVQDKLFQPFFSTKEEGTGLGLSIATRIVEEHGGWLDLVSKEGEGATFIINLPDRGMQ